MIQKKKAGRQFYTKLVKILKIKPLAQNTNSTFMPWSLDLNQRAEKILQIWNLFNLEVALLQADA